MNMITELINYVLPYWYAAWGSIQLAGYLMLGILAIEISAPGRRLHWKTVALNLCYAPFYLTIANILLANVRQWGDPWVPVNIFHISLPNAFSLSGLGWMFVYFAVFDFFYYWLHRAQHTWSILWRFHALHHADVNVSMSTTIRHHWLEESLRYFVILVPVAILFGPIPFWMAVVTGLYGLFIHWNMPWQLARIAPFIVTPWYHRIHHSTAREHFNKNFTVFFPLWDRLFGTYYQPKPGEYPETGVASLHSPNNWRFFMPWPNPR